MDVLCHEREGVDGALAVRYDLAESVQEILTVEIINKEIAPVVTPQHDVMQCSWCIQTGTAWREATLL
jgi:hypothetical protein